MKHSEAYGGPGVSERITMFAERFATFKIQGFQGYPNENKCTPWVYFIINDYLLSIDPILYLTKVI